MRTLGLPGAAIAVIAIPFVIASPREPEEPPTPDPVGAALTVHLAGAEGGKKPAYVHLTAAGQPPQNSTKFRLVDSTGLHSADAAVVSTASCSDAPIRRTGVADEMDDPTWCLQLKSVDSGTELKGSVTGKQPTNGAAGKPATKGAAATKLALTVMRRDAFWPGPLLTLVAGLLAGALAILVPRTVRGYVQEVALGRVLAKNREADPTTKIESLDTWVGDQLQRGKSPGTLAPLVASIVENGAKEARRARQALEATLDDLNPPDGAFTQGARAEAERANHKVSDFLAADGKKEAHPADVWSKGVTRLAEIVEVLTALDRRIEGELIVECRKEARTKLAEARVTLNGLEKPEDPGRLEPRVDAVRSAFENARANKDCLLPGLQSVDQEGAPTLGPAPEPAHSMITSGKRLGAATAEAVFWTAAIAAVTIAFAALTVYTAAYYGKHTFDSWSDYFLLFSAALGSSAAASVFAVLAYWDPGAVGEPASSSN